MSRGDISLGRRIRTSTAAQPYFPVFIDTLEDAIDHVQELPRQVADRSHWIAARDALWQAMILWTTQRLKPPMPPYVGHLPRRAGLTT